ncbi:MAG TPA: hypothetical protein VFN77_03720, partial [Acetobacteraceae bacterium]|nr:hypothetical protein [Acetobacteraceae bacterium]
MTRRYHRHHGGAALHHQIGLYLEEGAKSLQDWAPPESLTENDSWVISVGCGSVCLPQRTEAQWPGLKSPDGNITGMNCAMQA